MMYSISNILIQANINGYGTNTIASWAVYGKIDGIFWMTMDAMGISVTTFAGQNFGAGKIKRLKKGHLCGASHVDDHYGSTWCIYVYGRSGTHQSLYE